MKTLVTGGAGFIGSHLTERLLLDGVEVKVLDNLSNSKMSNVERLKRVGDLEFIQRDLLSEQDLFKGLRDCEVVWHIAANPDVRVGVNDPSVHYQQNVQATYNLLEAMRRYGGFRLLVFTSTSTVYGVAKRIPTPETYAPLLPISTYGASKLACEALIASYAHNCGFRAVVYRLANVVGPTSTHGVIHDFIKKLTENSHELEVLGNGKQTKSYLYITDCVDGMLLGAKKADSSVEIFNLGSEDQISVRKIAEIVTKNIGLERVRLKFTGSVNGGRGWPGDVTNMLLDTAKLRSKGWKSRYNSEQAVGLTVRQMLSAPQ